MPAKKNTDPEKPVRAKLAKQLGEARGTIKAVKDPSKALQNLDKALEKHIKKLKDGGEDGVC